MKKGTGKESSGVIVRRETIENGWDLSITDAKNHMRGMAEIERRRWSS